MARKIAFIGKSIPKRRTYFYSYPFFKLKRKEIIYQKYESYILCWVMNTMLYFFFLEMVFKLPSFKTEPYLFTFLTSLCLIASISFETTYNKLKLKQKELEEEWHKRKY